MNSTHPASPQLSPSQAKVLAWLARGHTKAEVSGALNISRHTVDFHTRNILTRLEARNVVAAVYRASHLGLIPPATDDFRRHQG